MGLALGDHLGIAGLIVAFLGIATFYLWPTKKWIGWIALACAAVLIVAWIASTLERPTALDKSKTQAKNDITTADTPHLPKSTVSAKGINPKITVKSHISFAYLQPISWNEERQCWIFVLARNGPDNLYNVHYSIADTSHSDQPVSPTDSNVMAANIDEMDVIRNMMIPPPLVTVRPRNIEHEDYLIDVTDRNAAVVEMLGIERSAGHWSYRLSVIDNTRQRTGSGVVLSNKQLVYCRDESFPVHQQADSISDPACKGKLLPQD